MLELYDLINEMLQYAKIDVDGNKIGITIEYPKEDDESKLLSCLDKLDDDLFLELWESMPNRTELLDAYNKKEYQTVYDAFKNESDKMIESLEAKINSLKQAFK